MAGTIVADTIQDGAGNSTSMDNAIYGSAKAWVNFSPSSTPTINASYNVSSITYIGTGQFTINITNAFVDNKYVTAGFGEWANGTSADAGITFGGDSSKTSSSFKVNFFVYPSGAQYNPVTAGVVCFR
jgi:hypothetical protein